MLLLLDLCCFPLTTIIVVMHVSVTSIEQRHFVIRNLFSSDGQHVPHSLNICIILIHM